ncbi:hypothetical protein TpMuguga_02g00716 [Theileria parva strain Muguga]|uniref:Uncharacterized protein n=1 Tax=Theileria parva TaxID=5875 RepID=Q4N4C3_THEPA|nr:uncharacterized protein TpMuguga_02g00716 [Theileria parva strain Muguga]EAN33000.1 hypothetical protein TpMuguga_02g00716 [Theileria parva strain Muguga]
MFNTISCDFSSMSQGDSVEDHRVNQKWLDRGQNFGK